MTDGAKRLFLGLLWILELLEFISDPLILGMLLCTSACSIKFVQAMCLAPAAF